MIARASDQPHAHEAEVAVLGGVIIDADAVALVAPTLSPDAFFDARHRLIYAAALRLFERGVTIDPVTLSEELRSTDEFARVGGFPYLAELMDAVPTAANIGYHAAIVADRATERRLLQASREIASDILTASDLSAAEKLDRAAERVLAIKTGADAGGEPEWVKQILYSTFADIEARQQRGGGIAGVPSGFADLDEMTGGFQPGDLVILAARPSMGKTSCAVGMALNAAITHQTPVAIYSLEMSKPQIVERMLCHEALVDLGKLRRGMIPADAYSRLAQAAGHLNTAPLYIDDRSATTITQLRASARRLKHKVPTLGMIVLDYVQYMAGGGAENRQQEVSQISRGLKFLAKEIGVPIIALSQLSRAPDQRTDHRPQLSDLRESGSLEQDADAVLFLYRPERYMTPQEAEEKGIVGSAELIVAKQRNGPTGTVDLYFRAECARYEAAAPRWMLHHAA